MGSCFQLSCHTDTDPRVQRGHSPGALARTGPGVTPSLVWRRTCPAWPAVSCSPGPGHQPRLQPEEPPCSCPRVPSPVSSSSYRLGYSFTGCREAELGSPRPREAKSHGGGQAGSPAHPGSDGFAEHSTVSPAKPSHPQTGAHSQDLGVALHFLVLRLFQSSAWFKLGALSSNHGFIRSATNVAADSSRL